MEEKELKTSPKQRVFISLIAIIMLGSVIASYVAIVMNGSKSSSSESEIDEAKIEKYAAEYEKEVAEFHEVTKGDFAKFNQYMSEVRTYDEAAANEGGVKTRDIVVGDGRELAEGDTDYLAYYVGFCADGSVFDSSLDSKNNPTAFDKAISASLGMIDGWNTGVVGMKLGGIRKITIPGELAYGDKMEICGGYNKPLRFLVMAVANEDPLKTAASEVDTAFMKLQYAYYGIDYDTQMGN